MATEYYLMAGDQVVDQVDVSTFDTGFFDLIREVKAALSNEAKEHFFLVDEYSMYPDEGEGFKADRCTDSVFNEIREAWLN